MTPKKTTRTPKRIRRTPDEAKHIILDKAKTIMLEEGYAAVSTRRVAKVAGVSATLVHYYYPTTEDLVLALFSRESKKDLESLEKALSSNRPLSALWIYQTDPARAAFSVEFLALANHRKVVKTEMIRYAESVRTLQANALSRLHHDKSIDPAVCSSLCMATLVTCLSRALIMEQGVGIALGHAELRMFVEWMLARLQPL